MLVSVNTWWWSESKKDYGLKYLLLERGREE